MSILKSNSAGIESRMKDWLDTYVVTDVLPNVIKTEIGKVVIDVNSYVMIHDFPDEELPDFIVFNKIDGDFELSQCHRLNSVYGFPVEITGDFICNGCEQLAEDAILFVEKERVCNMVSVDAKDPKSVKGWLRYFQSGRAEERPLRKIGGKIEYK